MCCLWKYIVVLSAVFSLGSSYRLLLLFPFPSRSHMILGEAYVKFLLDQDHDITYITPTAMNSTNSRLRQIEINSVKLKAIQSYDFVKIVMKKGEERNIEGILNVMHDIAADVLQHKNVQKILNDTDEHYDAVIVEWMYTEIYAGYILPKEKELYRRVYGPAVAKRGHHLPPFDVIRFNGSLMLGNSHPSIGVGVSLPQSYKSIGGFHIIESQMEPLSDDLRKVMDESTEGVIYFSLGSIVQTTLVPETTKANLLKSFGLLNQTVIWKLDEIPSNLPSNVHVVSWAPQQSILAHPNTVLFITHGGVLSIYEAVHFGVPVIGIPAFGDQFINVARIVGKGMAKRVRLTSNLHNDLIAAVQEVLYNKSYQTNVNELSVIYHDRPVPAGAELTHWVQHVVRTRGALHLRSPALLLSWYQKLYLDLAALVFVGFGLVCIATNWLFKFKSIAKVDSGKKLN